MIRQEAYSGEIATSLIYTSRNVHRQKKKHTMSLSLIWLIDKALKGQFSQTDKTDILLHEYAQNESKTSPKLGKNCVSTLNP